MLQNYRITELQNYGITNILIIYIDYLLVIAYSLLKWIYEQTKKWVWVRRMTDLIKILPWQCCYFYVVTESCSVCGRTRKRVFLGGIFIKIYQSKDLVQIDIQQSSDFCDKLLVSGNEISASWPEYLNRRGQKVLSRGKRRFWGYFLSKLQVLVRLISFLLGNLIMSSVKAWLQVSVIV